MQPTPNFVERGKQAVFDPSVEHGVGRLVNEQGHAHLLEDLCGLASTLGAVGRDANVERLALVHGGGERSHGLFKRAVLPRAVGVEDVDVFETHALETVVERGEQVLARGSDAVGAGPHVPAGLGGDDELVAQAARMFAHAKVFAERDAEVLFGGTVGRAVVVGEVEVGDAAVEGAANHGAAGLKDIRAAKVLPQAEGDGGQHEAGVAATAEDGVVIAGGSRNELFFHRSLMLMLQPFGLSGANPGRGVWSWRVRAAIEGGSAGIQSPLLV